MPEQERVTMALSEHKDAVAMAKALDEISVINMVLYYRRELALIEEGRHYTKLLPDSIVNNFIRTGILEKLHWPNRLNLTEKARSILQDSQ